MSLSVEIYEHPKAGMYYLIFQHDHVYEMNVFKNQSDQHCVYLGDLWPAGEADLGLKVGQHLRLKDVPKIIQERMMTIITNKITHV